jgi:hypothetical protein
MITEYRIALIFAIDQRSAQPLLSPLSTTAYTRSAQQHKPSTQRFALFKPRLVFDTIAMCYTDTPGG